MNEQNDRGQSKISILDIAIQDSGFRREELTNELDDKKAELACLRKSNAEKLEQWIEDEEKLNDRLIAKEREIESIKENFKSIESGIKETTSELISQRTELELMLDERDFMKGNYEERRADLENEISNYKTAITSMTSEINNSMNRVIKKEADNLEVSEKVAKLKTKVKTTLDGQETEINRLKDRLEELREMYDKEETHAMNLLATRVEMKAFMESSKELNTYNKIMHSNNI